MAPTKITVIGRAVIPHKAERAVIDVEITHEGKQGQEVSEAVASSSSQLQTFLKSMSSTQSSDASADAASAASPLSTWKMDSFRSTSHLPEDENHNIMADGVRVYSTSVAYQLEVRDFSKLGSLAQQLSTIPHTKINGLSWKLTEGTKKSFESELRKLAVKDALQRTRDYAGALGLETVRCTEIRELAPYPGGMMMAESRGQRGLRSPEACEEESFENLEFVAEEIKMESEVDCQFEAE